MRVQELLGVRNHPHPFWTAAAEEATTEAGGESKPPESSFPQQPEARLVGYLQREEGQDGEGCPHDANGDAEGQRLEGRSDADVLRPGPREPRSHLYVVADAQRCAASHHYLHGQPPGG